MDDNSPSPKTDKLQHEYDSSGRGRGGPPRPTSLGQESLEPEPPAPLAPFGPRIVSYKSSDLEPPISLAVLANLRRVIKRVWFPPVDDNKKKTLITFSVDSGGKFLNVLLVHYSGSEAADEAAMKAIKRINYFRAFLAEGIESVDIVATFWRQEIQIDLGNCSPPDL